MMEPVRVVVADDHELLRGLICKILASDPGIEVIDEASNGAEALEQVKIHNPDVLVSDLQMPVLNGVEVVESVREEKLPVKVLLLSSPSDPYYAQSVMEIGASGYLPKDELYHELVDTVLQVAGEKRHH